MDSLWKLTKMLTLTFKTASNKTFFRSFRKTEIFDRPWWFSGDDNIIYDDVRVRYNVIYLYAPVLYNDGSKNYDDV